ncbi:oxidoreductase-like protein [Trypanosoma theileri]|uniref:Oxidoreductase-like protein n=1 Tax=Trypanosoma theileri TaxID=67003 RepID=A0A1X0NXP4_9TRYP|nr:oxidoreductase-like protein [Trypanosoma theileri]ORC89253.1 oxidoreductase-like protein [Trypanosoma theileri]
MTQPIRVGLLGASAIAGKVWRAIQAAGLVVTAVGSRNPSKAETFVQECSTELHIDVDKRPRVCTYDELVTSDDVDIVYISIPVMERLTWVMKCAHNGKHVVGEKPPAENADVLQSWLDQLRVKKLLYMDGTMFSHGPWLKKLLQTIPRCGSIRRLTATLTWYADEENQKTNIRFNPALENLGALGDCGWYCVRAMLHIMQFHMPISAVGRILETNDKGAIVAFSGELTFNLGAENITGFFYCGFNSAAQAELTISGTTGIIESPNIYNPITKPPGHASFKFIDASTKACGTKLTVKRDEDIIEVPEEDGYFQEAEMWRDVAASLSPDAEGRLVASAEAIQKWGRMSWMTQFVLDKLLESARMQVS